MKCVKDCEFIGGVEDGYICKFHRVEIKEDQNEVLHRCINCERHAYYNRLVGEMSEFIDKHNEYVSKTDKMIDDIHFLMKMVKEKI